MGFYGNITNTNKTQFTFDAIFSSRYDMENNIGGQEIYVGRYVLVEYDSTNSYIKIYKDGDNFYSIPNHKQDIRYRIKFDTDGSQYNPNTGEGLSFIKDQIGQDDSVSPNKFYKCVGADGNYAKFEEVSDDTYSKNYKRDYEQYKNSRGYDSTVWQKTFVDGHDKYVMVAELNSVVPTFDLVADAPTSIPMIPHFDSDSTNVYYKLHWQPNWGFKVKESDEYSDSIVEWLEYEYNPSTGEDKPISGNYNGLIFFNNDAFDPQIGKTDINKHIALDDYIKIETTASGNKYSDHLGGFIEKPDTKELSIFLPSIGNMMSDAWDIIHGLNRDDSTIDSLQGRLDFFTEEIEANEIPIQSTKGGYLVGTKINGGVKDATEDILSAELSESSTQDDPWIRTDINVIVDLENPNYHQNAISIHHTWHPTEDTTSGSDMNEGKDTIELYTPLVDAAGHIVGKNTETVTLPYGYKTIKAENLERDLAPYSNVIDRGQSAQNTQDIVTFKSSNKWIKIDNEAYNGIYWGHEIVGESFGEQKSNSQDLTPAFGSAFKIPVLTVDNAGHLTAFETESVKIPGITYTNDSNTTNDVLQSLTYTYDVNNDVAIWRENRVHVDNLIIQDYNVRNEEIETGQEIVYDSITIENEEEFLKRQEDFGILYKRVKNYIYEEMRGYDGSLASYYYNQDENYIEITINSQEEYQNAVNTYGALYEKIERNSYEEVAAYDSSITLYYTKRTIVYDITLNNKDTIHGAFAKLQGQIKAMDLDEVGGNLGDYIVSISEEDGHVKAQSASLPSVEDTKVEGQFVSAISEEYGTIKVERTEFSPSITITSGTNNEAPKVSVNINTISGIAQELNKASTEAYGATKLTSTYDGADSTLAVTGAAIKDAFTTLSTSGTKGSSQVITSWKQENGIVSFEFSPVSISNGNITANANIAMSKIEGLEDALNGKQFTIPENTYDAYGSATAILGAETDTVESKTIYGLLKKIEALEARIAALETPPTA